MSLRLDAVPMLSRWALLVPSRRHALATPDAPAVVLTGTVHGDPRFPNGAAIVTSCVLELDAAGAFARTRTSRYRLGRPSRPFLRWVHELGCTLDDFSRSVGDGDRCERRLEQSSAA